MARASEDELIARYFAPLASPGALSLLDDAALLTPRAGHSLVLTVDAIVEGVHFLPGDPPASLAAKALGVNLSDLAAKGAEPSGFLLTLALPDGWTEDWLAGFSEGLGQTARAAACPLLGGDTVRAAGPLSLSVTAIGEVPDGAMVHRTTARPGDLVCVSGTIGDAALGLTLLRDEPSDPMLADEDRAFLIDRYRHPRPRLALAAALRAHASAAMDVSDGLAGDLAKMLRVSGVSGMLDLGRIPLSRAARSVLDSAATAPGRDTRRVLERIAGGGDDYEILFTLPPERWGAMTREAAAIDLPVTVIGEVRAGEAPLDIRLNGEPHGLEMPSFQHFRGTAPEGA